MKKLALCLTLAILIITLVIPATTGAQANIFPVVLNSNQFAYVGPSTNSVLIEYLAAGRNSVATGRSVNGDWVRLDIGVTDGWVPAAAVDGLTTETLDALPVVAGWIPGGEGVYAATNRQLRDVQIDMIIIQRPLYDITSRYTRLQAGRSASCDQLPFAPGAPGITAGEIGAVPELETFRRELTWVADEVSKAIAAFETLCSGGGTIDFSVYQAGLGDYYGALEVFHNLRKYMFILTGMIEAAS